MYLGTAEDATWEGSSVFEIAGLAGKKQGELLV
jgi:hypothetical protein